VKEIFDSIRWESLGCVFVLCHRRPKRRRNETDGEFFDRIDIRREDFICRTRSSVCSFSTIPWKQRPSERTTRRRDERRENDEKWTVTRIPFSRSDTYASARVKEPTKIVTFRPLSRVHLLSYSSSSSSSPYLRPTISFVTSSKCARQRHSPPSLSTLPMRRERRALDNGIIDRHVQPTTTRVIAPFDEPELSTGIRIRSAIHRSLCAWHCRFPVDRDSYSPQPRRTTCAKLVV